MGWHIRRATTTIALTSADNYAGIKKRAKLIPPLVEGGVI